MIAVAPTALLSPHWEHYGWYHTASGRARPLRCELTPEWVLSVGDGWPAFV